MVFLCGLFFPIEKLPLALRPVSYALPLTYGADVLHGAVNDAARLPLAADFCSSCSAPPCSGSACASFAGSGLPERG